MLRRKSKAIVFTRDFTITSDPVFPEAHKVFGAKLSMRKQMSGNFQKLYKCDIFPSKGPVTPHNSHF